MLHHVLKGDTYSLGASSIEQPIIVGDEGPAGHQGDGKVRRVVEGKIVSLHQPGRARARLGAANAEPVEVPDLQEFEKHGEVLPREAFGHERVTHLVEREVEDRGSDRASQMCIEEDPRVVRARLAAADAPLDDHGGIHHRGVAQFGRQLPGLLSRAARISRVESSARGFTRLRTFSARAIASRTSGRSPGGVRPSLPAR